MGYNFIFRCLSDGCGGWKYDKSVSVNKCLLVDTNSGGTPYNSDGNDIEVWKLKT